MQFILSTIVFFFLLFFLWDVKLPMQASIKETWLWNKEGAFGTSVPKIGENPIQTLNGYKRNQDYYSFATGKFSNYTEPFNIDFALLSPGYIEYEKIGDEVNFFSASGELFWKKPINSYPRSGYYGTPVLYLSGDNNTVFLLDTSGNLLGAGELNGRFLTDYDFDKNGRGAIILFSGGEVYRVDEKGVILFKKDLSESKSTSFFKSISLSPNGKNTLIHFSFDQKDNLMILDEKGEIVEEWEINGFYPHKLYFAISDSLNSLVNFPDKTTFFEKDEIIWEEKKNKIGPIYQTVYAQASIFAYGGEKDVFFLNDDGKTIRTKSVSSSETPIRFFPSKLPGIFYMETKKDIYQFTVFR
jgi:hypothetical protein